MNSDSSTRRERGGAHASTRGLAISALFSLALAVLGSNHALAADVRCGVDTDLSGTVDTMCPSPDADGDGYFTNGLGDNSGTDCYETGTKGFFIYPGISTDTGCSAGNYRTCQSDGTFTSCAAVSGYTCHTGSGSTYFVDDAESDCSGAGTYADPEDWRCWVDTGMSGYHAPVAGDCIVFLAGTYSSTWSSGTKQFYVNNKDGTSSNYIRFRALPGATWWEAGVGSGVVIQGAGAFGGVGEVFPLMSTLSDYNEYAGFEVKNAGSGFSNTGIHIEQSTWAKVYNNYIHDIDGEEDNNVACIKPRVTATGAEIHHNVVKDCYERQATTGDAGWNSQNNSGIRSMDSDEVNIHDNVVINTANAGDGISFKHGIANAVGVTANRNIIIGTGYGGVIVDAIKNSQVKKNFLSGVCSLNPTTAVCPGALQSINLGGLVNAYENITFEYNTVIDAPAAYFFNTTDTGVTANSIIFRYNVISDNKASSYSTDNSANGFYSVAGYGSDAMRTDQNSRMISDYNCYYNSAGTTLRFSYFEATSGGWGPAGAAGQASSGFSSWLSNTPFDDNSFNENPTLDSYGRATSTNCANKGWLLVSESTPTGGGSACLRMRSR